ncbi:TIGR01777 family oxidoreductase [Fredinandcohnia humi]
MKIAIAGGTGFIGKALTSYLLKKKHMIYILTRDISNKEDQQNLKFIEWLSPKTTPEEHLEGIDAFINLSGESLNSGRWTKQRKKRIVSSRVDTTKEVVRILSSLKSKPKVLLNTSAIGIYGTSLGESFSESSSTVGSDFLATTVSVWEQEALKATKFGIRTCLLRLGVVLGQGGGALNRMIMPYQFFIGGTIGSGKQWLSWIHIDDVIKSIEFLLYTEAISGPINLTAPNPVQMKEFGRTISEVLKRPHWLPVPSFALKLLLGQMSILVLEGQRVLPKKLQDHGYSFSYVTAKDALGNIKEI